VPPSIGGTPFYIALFFKRDVIIKSMKKKILLIEDDISIAKVLTLKLSKSGFEVAQRSSGEGGLEAIKKEKFDLVLLDLILSGMNGFDVLAKLQKDKNTIPVIVLSNLGQKEDIKKAAKLGASGYVVKSKLPLADLVDKINKALKNNG
jgi:two-component system alkaline phosphatase synthesis response regulator PhoP